MKKHIPDFYNKLMLRGLKALFGAMCAMRVMAVAALLMLAGAWAPVASALSLATYAENSRLSSGRWVKVAVNRTGMHLITDASLRSWGFPDPSKVKVFGHGGRRLPDLLAASSYTDDLPQTASEYVAGKGLFFFAEGVTSFTESSTGYFVPAQNPFSNLGYYFLSDSVEEERLTPTNPPYEGSDPYLSEVATYFMDRVWHEVDAVSPGEAGFLLVGEDFRTVPTQNFNFTLPGITGDEPTRMEVAFVTKSVTTRSTLELSVNGTALPVASTDRFNIVTDTYSHGNQLQTRKTFELNSSNLTVGVTHNCPGSVVSANLNYIAINYPRKLALPAYGGITIYTTSSPTAYRIADARGDTRVWGVGNPLAPTSPRVKSDGDGNITFYPTSRKADTYVAWSPGASGYPAPTFVEAVRNQNLHALPTTDMVIFTPKEWKDHAERLAEFHRKDSREPLSVTVLTPQEVYNEFSSGTPDVQAFRKLMKMMYDRGAQGDTRLRYAIMFSRPTYDFRRMTDKVKTLGYPMLPAWFTERGLNDNDSYTTDDILAFLEDNSGVNTGRDRLSIALGRIPATSQADAKVAVDKIISYSEKPNRGAWRNVVLLVADDQDNAVHMIDAERQWKSMMGAQAGGDVFYKKLYTDEFELVGNVYEEARTLFYRYLDEGVMWWSFQGHANPAMLTAEGLVTYRDLNGLYLRNLPVVFAATCDFMRWDSATISGAEILFSNPSGGVIAAISATRPVYIADNGYLCESTGRELFTRNDDGSIRTLGEVYRMGKNRYRYNNGTVVSNTNKLRYVLLGDPAMRIAMPSLRAEINRIGEQPVTPLDNALQPVEIMARQQTTFSGRIADSAGNPIPDFNGTVTVTLYDAEYSVTTRGNGNEGVPYTFDQQGSRLFVGSAKVVDGEFTVNVAMPAEVSDNYRPAAINIYAQATDGREAAGVCRDLYVYGTDPNAIPDDVPPVIQEAYLNHPTFRDGQQVNSSPMLIATVTDDRAINLSSAGVGHQMQISLDDGNKTFTDVADYFLPFSDGRPGGSIAYPMENIAVGWHQLRLRVWDTGPNSTEAIINFEVAKEIAPSLYDVYTQENPVSTEANFYLSHDRPDGNLTVTIEVFNLMGKKIWEKTQTGRSDMFTSMPVTWDLCDNGGHRVGRGIYLYRATVTDDDSGNQSTTASRKLAVRGAN